MRHNKVGSSPRTHHHHNLHQKSHPTTLLSKNSVTLYINNIASEQQYQLNHSLWWHSIENRQFIGTPRTAVLDNNNTNNSDLASRLASQLTSWSQSSITTTKTNIESSNRSDWDIMPAPKLIDRRPDTVPVLTETIADQVKKKSPSSTSILTHSLHE